jgi:isopenicillin-N N-acyltransferase like protein
MMPDIGHPVVLGGNAHARGLAQAHGPDEVRAAVRHAIELRLLQARTVLDLPDSRHYLRAVHDHTGTVAPEALREMEGIAEGFGIAADRLFAYLHVAILADMAVANAPPSTDGCSAWARLDAGGKAWLGKNRDFRGEHKSIQRVFRHRDPAWEHREVLCVGSLGAPGAYSSGINTDGLALADTQITTRDHGVGLCRYFLMTEILARCATVPAAIELIRSFRHAGGGALILADAAGNRAAVELGHGAVAVETPPNGEPVGRTNHFVGTALAAANIQRPGEPMAMNSRARLATLCKALDAPPADDVLGWTAKTMGSHDAHGVTGLCRHGQDGDSSTISCSLFATGDPSLYFCEGNPCTGAWRRYGF